MSTWKIPPRRFPHGSISQIYAVPELGQEELDPKTKRMMEHFEQMLSAGLDWMQEQLGSVFLGVPLINQRGPVTVADTDSTATATFATEEVDTNYSVFVSPSTAMTFTKTTTGFTMNLAAPASGDTTYDYIIVREILR